MEKFSKYKVVRKHKIISVESLFRSGRHFTTKMIEYPLNLHYESPPSNVYRNCPKYTFTRVKSD
jgi:hypothetical protein